jgi:hypothetical protein
MVYPGRGTVSYEPKVVLDKLSTGSGGGRGRCYR